MNYTFNAKNPRVHLAQRQKIFHSTTFRVVNFLLFMMLISGGVALLIMHTAFGWVFLGFAVLPLMFTFWTGNALSNNPTKETDDFTDALDGELLTLMHEKMNCVDLVKIISEDNAGIFMMVRFDFSIPMFEDAVSFLPDPNNVEPIFKTAVDIQKKTNSEAITGATLLAALIFNLPRYEYLLSQFKLNKDDIFQGVIWYNYLNGIVKDSKKPMRSGGIGRDFAFGFTPTLLRFATNLSNHYRGVSQRVQQAENDKIFEQIIYTFTHGGRQNVALIGKYGSGRSSIVESLAETLMNADSNIPRSLKYHQIYSLDTTSLISAASNQSELEYILVRILNEVYAAKNIILCLDNAHLFFEEGPGSIDITNFLTPVIEGGGIRMILIMDDQKFLEISARNSALANSLNKIIVHPADKEETMKILMDQIPIHEKQKNVIYTYQSLTTAYRLSEQYIHDVEMPGKAKLLLESAASYSDDGLVTGKSVETAVEKSYGVKVKVAEEAEDREKLLNLEELIHERMIDQQEAVSAVANALRRAGAGVKNQGRPIGTFLFLGPTGVGKTELAKTLSEVYFNGEEQIVRLDMNEFVEASDVSRLIRDGAVDELSLAAQVMKRPFSVVLLDEIEKAHPAVLTTLLQVLDEGILRDEKNREVSFRDAIIIATSNAGANTIRDKIESGSTVEEFKDEFVNELINSGEFKPEFLNRFDEICIFKPLSKEDLVQILDLIIASTNKTLGAQKITVEVTPEAKSILIEQGYDPKMGARPMRRMVQKTVENIVASAILAGSVSSGHTLKITPEMIVNN